ncbi:MAG: TonB-dependent receptor, partial [Caulobacteraceae bacterium]|nr:TonB-dependent receptor [Caulobacteraceae bacterium]
LGVIYDGRPDAPLISGVTAVRTAAGQPTPNITVRNYLNDMNADSFKLDFDTEIKPGLTLKAGYRYQQTNIAIAQRAQSAIAGTTGLPFGFTTAKAVELTAALYPGGSAGFLTKQNFGVDLPLMSLTSGLDVIPQLRDLQLTKANEDRAFGFKSHEQTHAIYGQVDFEGEFGAMPYEGNAGVRAVYTDLLSSAFQTVTLTAGAGRIVSQQAIPISDTNKYWEYLPSANLTLHPMSNVNVRLGVSKVMTRPEYESTAPKNTVTIFDRTDPTIDPTQLDNASTGNTKLKPLTAWQYDGTVEYYTGNGGAYYLSGYYKDITDFILRGVVQRGVTVLGQGSRLFNSTSTINVAKGKVYGFEIGLDQPLTFLPPAFEGFGVQANYTFVESELKSSNPQLAFGVPGASKHNFNGVVYYEKGPFSTRLAYAYRGDFFQQLGGGVDRATQPTFTKGYGSLDLSAGFKIRPNLEITVAGSNLTGENRRDFMIDPDVFRSFIQRSKIYSVSLRGTF